MELDFGSAFGDDHGGAGGGAVAAARRAPRKSLGRGARSSAATDSDSDGDHPPTPPQGHRSPPSRGSPKLRGRKSGGDSLPTSPLGQGRPVPPAVGSPPRLALPAPSGGGGGGGGGASAATAAEIASAQRDFAAAIGTPLLRPAGTPGAGGAATAAGGAPAPPLSLDASGPPPLPLLELDSGCAPPATVAAPPAGAPAAPATATVAAAAATAPAPALAAAAPPALPLPALPKTSPADFRLLSVIGRGAYGKVLQVAHVLTGRVYAMKVLDKGTLYAARPDAGGRRALEYTRVERDVMTRLRHPYIVPLRYAFQTGDKLFLVSDFCGGGELFAALNRRGMVLEDAARVYLAQIVLALEYLHSHGIIHRCVGRPWVARREGRRGLA
jgi:hypothetical protein